MRPYFIISNISGIIIFLAFIFFIKYLTDKKENTYKLVVLLSLIGIGFGIHGLQPDF